MSSSSPISHQYSACIPISDCVEPGPSRQILNDLSTLNLSFSSLDSVILSIPDLSGPSSSIAVEAPQVPCSQNSDSDLLPYNLRPRENRGGSGLAVGGLASNPVVIGARKLRGRKSNLSKAQSKTVVDIADGKQMSLTGVLRAERPPPEDVP